MKHPVNPREDFDWALSSLAQTPTPAGMEERILHRLQERRAEADGAGIGLISSASGRSFRLALAGAMAATVVVAFAFGLRHGAIPFLPQARLEASSRTSGALTETRTSVAKPMQSRLVSQSRHAAVHHGANIRRAVSFPAPEAPLTHEEKLLLVIARSPQPELRAALDLARSTETVEQSNHQLEASFHSSIPGGFK